MKSRLGLATAIAACMLLMLAVLLPAEAASARDEPPVDKLQDLVEQYAPVLYFHPDELFRPQTVDVLLNTAQLRQSRKTLPDMTVLASISQHDLPAFQNTSYYLDIWLGDNGASDARNYSALRDYYLTTLSPLIGGPPMVAYARLTTDEGSGRITIQYWFFYFYNDWFNKHEGDWEMIQVMLDRAGRPEWAVYSQHEGGTRRRWQDVPREDGTHPVVYVALGSHANYFRGDELFPHGRTVGNSQVEVVDRTGRNGRIELPVIVLLEDRSRADGGPAPSDLAWLDFAGHWGENTAVGGFSGPLGPAFKGEQWDRPYAWGTRQPLDLETWYGNRLRVAVSSAAAEVTLVSNLRTDNATVETLPGLVLLHADPLPNEVFTANIQTPPGERFDLIAMVPSPETKQIARYLFRSLTTADTGRAYLAMRAGDAPVLFVEGSSPRWPNALETADALWDAPDLVWMAQTASAGELLLGLLLSFLAGVVPAYLCLTLLYCADLYEKEPLRLILAAFFWGAWPAFLIGLAVVVIFRLPIELWGRDAVEAVRVGLLAPVIEELAKGAVVLFIVHRYRSEIDSVHDGIIYGAAVGLGFAMTANMLSFMGAFLVHGFVELQQKILVEGLLHGFNHAFYTAFFGAGLAYATFTRSRTQRWAVPLGALLLAMTANGLHGLIQRSSLGINPLAIGLTWLGIIAIVSIMAWSLGRQHRCIRRELVGEAPEDVRRTLLHPLARAWAEGRALLTGGWRCWRRTRQIFQLSAELAFRKAQSSAQPDKPKLVTEVNDLRAQLQELLGGSAEVKYAMQPPEK